MLYSDEMEELHRYPELNLITFVENNIGQESIKESFGHC